MPVIEGVVEHEDARGRTLGFPTANISLSGTGIRIEDDVWTARVQIKSRIWVVAEVSAGRRRTFYAVRGPRLLEAHRLDFDGDLYDPMIRIELDTHLRDQQGFSDVHVLTAQLHRDVEETRAWTDAHCPWIPTTRGLNSPTKARA